MPSGESREEVWPALPLEGWKATYETLHLWTQIVGKIRLTQSPWVNHSWHVTLYVTSRGLTTSPIPHGTRTFEIEFDFLRHVLLIQVSDGQTSTLPLLAQSVAAFYGQVLERLERLALPVKVHKNPNELPEPIPFDQDDTHCAYDPDFANRFWRVLVQADRVLKQFRASFLGKCSPVHLFWGALDLAVTRFSGREAPRHPGGIPNLPDWVTREAYSQEVSSCGFWPGGGAVPYPAFYSYTYPEPAGFKKAPVMPAEAFYSTDLGEFILPYDVVRLSSMPDVTLLEFLQSTYEAGANLGRWDRQRLERSKPPRSQST